MSEQKILEMPLADLDPEVAEPLSWSASASRTPSR